MSIAAESKRASAPACKTVGPIKNATQARQIRAALLEKAQQVELREKRLGDDPGFIIVSDDQGTIEGAKELAAKMEVAGVDDFFVFTRGKYTGHVSLGLYKSEPLAQERIDEVKAAGFNAELIPRGRKNFEYWIDLAVASNDEAREDVELTLAPLTPAIKATPMPCDDMVASAE